MATFTTSDNVGGDMPVGAVLNIAGAGTPYIIYEVTTTTLSVAKWTWVSKVIAWNPCNGIQLVANV